MKGQIHNDGVLKELTVNIEEQVVLDLEKMSDISKISIDELVCVAIKRFRSSHADYMGNPPTIDGE